MSERPTLAEVFSRAEYRLSGHGPRNADVLKAVLEQVDGNMESDMYGKGKVIEDFQEEMAGYLGKEAAVFFPSGTMAQQIALRIHCDEKKLAQVAYHPLCHLEIHEEDGLKELHGIRPILLADRHRLITLEDVTGLGEEIACLLLELPQREIGGQLPEFRELEAIAAYCREKGIKLHLDGARLFEILPYYGKTAAEVCALFDSVYVSFYKSIGGIAGAILAGDAGFAEQSKVWKRRHGGDLISPVSVYFDECALLQGTHRPNGPLLSRGLGAVRTISGLSWSNDPAGGSRVQPVSCSLRRAEGQGGAAADCALRRDRHRGDREFAGL